MFERFLAVIERVLDALLKQSAHFRNRFVAEIATHDVTTERQRQAGLFLPPHSEIDNEAQSLILECQLPFVDNQTRVELTGFDDLQNFIERHHLVLEALRQE